MIELHIELKQLTLEKALHSTALAKVKYVGLLLDDLTIDSVKVQEIRQLAQKFALFYDIEVFLGFQFIYTPPQLIVGLVEEVRGKGFDYIAVHGENIHSNIAKGTNLAALNADVDILFNAGIIDECLIEFAQTKSTAFEFNLNPYYAGANAQLVEYAIKYNFSMVWGNTIQTEKDFIYSLRKAENINLCPKAKELDLIKKLNEDTFSYIQKLMARR